MLNEYMEFNSDHFSPLETSCSACAAAISSKNCSDTTVCNEWETSGDGKEEFDAACNA